MMVVMRVFANMRLLNPEPLCLGDHISMFELTELNVMRLSMWNAQVMSFLVVERLVTYTVLHFAHIFKLNAEMASVVA